MNDARSEWTLWILLLSACLAGPAAADGDPIDFASENWTKLDARVVEHLGRPCLEGSAILAGVEFTDGVIEVDLAVSGARSYPGIVFRRQSATDLERFYVRPHRSNGAFSDALQYTPVFNGIAGWQLYNGSGFTNYVTMPSDEWVHLKLEVKGTQARVFVGDGDAPDLVIHELKHGRSKGEIGVMGPKDGTAFFSNFSFRADDGLAFDPPPEIAAPIGMMTDWELSQSFDYSKIDIEESPDQQGMKDFVWQKVTGEQSGLVDIARFVKRTPGEPDFVWARRTLHAEDDEAGKLELGYSDYVSVFLNGQLLYLGNSAYRSRSPEFAGIVGLNDTLYLPLKKGDNELLLLVGESFGGWGFMARDGNAIFVHEDLARSWEVSKTFKFPESVAYDSQRDVLYVSNFFAGGNEFISKVKRDGEIEELQWVAGLNRPTGLCVSGSRLFAAERANVAEIDIVSGKIAKRYPVPEPGLPNDTACDASGAVYVSDSQKNVIYKVADGEVVVWLEAAEISQPNGLLLDGDKLLVGNTGDGCLKRVKIADRSVETVACLGSGSIVDGIRPDGRGNYIVSDYNGRVFLITPEGETTPLLNTSARGINTADLEFVPEHGLLVIPTLNGNQLIAYRFDGIATDR